MLNIDGYKLFKRSYNNFELMDSWSWNTILPSETAYSWQSQELKWRHAMKPASGIIDLQTPASYLRRWDGGERITSENANFSYISYQLENYDKPMPS